MRAADVTRNRYSENYQQALAAYAKLKTSNKQFQAFLEVR
jgi:hypothetical protein